MFLKKHVDAEAGIMLTEARLYSSSVRDRIDYILYYKPEWDNFTNTELSWLLGCARETISRARTKNKNKVKRVPLKSVKKCNGIKPLSNSKWLRFLRWHRKRDRVPKEEIPLLRPGWIIRKTVLDNLDAFG